MAGSLTSPSTEFSTGNSFPASSGKSSSLDQEENKGSIVGLGTSRKLTGNPEGNSPAMAKPKPLPKPRPWSIVGVDRKSGEMTQVSSDSEAKKSPNPELRKTGNNPELRKSSVRDLINNMNKESSSDSASGFRKKGNSLPRGTNAPGSGNPDGAESGMNKSENAQSDHDDPRILKLEDDFAYEDVMDV